MTVITYTGLCG